MELEDIIDIINWDTGNEHFHINQHFKLAAQYSPNCISLVTSGLDQDIQAKINKNSIRYLLYFKEFLLYTYPQYLEEFKGVKLHYYGNNFDGVVNLI